MIASAYPRILSKRFVAVDSSPSW